MANILKTTSINGDLNVTGNTNVEGTIIGNLSGNASTATKVDIINTTVGQDYEILVGTTNTTESPRIVHKAKVSVSTNGDIDIDVSGNLNAENISATSFSGNGAHITNISASNITGTIDAELIDITTKSEIATNTSTPVTIGTTTQALNIDGDGVSINSDVTVAGNLNVTGSANIGSGITVQGDKTIVDATTLSTSDTLIELGKGNTAALTNYAGFYVPNYDGTNTGAIVFDNTGTAYVGDVNIDPSTNTISPINAESNASETSLQPLATRKGIIAHNSLIKWNNTAKTLVGASASDITEVAVSEGVYGRLAAVSSTGATTSIYRTNINLADGNSISGIENVEVLGNVNVSENVTASNINTETIVANVGMTVGTINSSAIVNGKVEIGENTVVLKYTDPTTSVTSEVVSISNNGTITTDTFIGSLSGNASTATQFENPITLEITGGATASAQTVTGTQNISLNVTSVLPSVIASGIIGNENAKVDLVGNAESATVASSLTTSTAGTSEVPVYFSDGIPVQTSTTLGVCITGIADRADKIKINASSTVDKVYIHGASTSGADYKSEYDTGLTAKTFSGTGNVELAAATTGGSVNITGQAKTVDETIVLSKNASGSVDLTTTGSRNLDVTITEIGDATASTNIPVYQTLNFNTSKGISFDNGWTMNDSGFDIDIASSVNGSLNVNQNLVVGKNIKSDSFDTTKINVNIINNNTAGYIRLYDTLMNNEHNNYIELQPAEDDNINSANIYRHFLKFNRFTYSDSNYYLDNSTTAIGQEIGSEGRIIPMIFNIRDGIASVAETSETSTDQRRDVMLKYYKGAIVRATPGIDYLTTAADISAKSLIAEPFSGTNMFNYTYDIAGTAQDVTAENTNMMREYGFLPFFSLTKTTTNREDGQNNTSIYSPGNYTIKSYLPNNLFTYTNTGEITSVGIDNPGEDGFYKFPFIKHISACTETNTPEVYKIHGVITRADISESTKSLSVDLPETNPDKYNILYNNSLNQTNYIALPNNSVLGTATDLNSNKILTGISYSSSANGNSLVYRMANGDFSAGTITANLSGNASSATLASNIAGGSTNQLVYQSATGQTAFHTVSANTVVGYNEDSALTNYKVLTNVNTSGNAVVMANDGNFTANTITANLSGNASTATALAQDVTFNLQGTSQNANTSSISVSSNLSNGAIVNLNITYQMVVDALGFNPASEYSAMLFKGFLSNASEFETKGELSNGDVYIAQAKFSITYNKRNATGITSSATLSLENGDLLIAYKAKDSNIDKTYQLGVIERNHDNTVVYNGKKESGQYYIPVFSDANNVNISDANLIYDINTNTLTGQNSELINVTGNASTANHANESTKLVYATNNTYADYDIGSSTVPVYFSGGIPVETSTTLGVCITGNASTATYATSAGTASSATVASSLATASAGSSSLPVYFSDGAPVETSTTLGVCITGNAATADLTASIKTTTASASTNYYLFGGSGDTGATTGAIVYNTGIVINDSTIGESTSPVTVIGSLTGTADSAKKLVAANGSGYSAGSSTEPVYFDTNGHPQAVGATLSKDISGNAATASAFDSNKDITLSGVITGTASSTGGWTITTAVGNLTVTDSMIDSVAASKISDGTITANLNGNASTATSLNLNASNAFLYQSGNKSTSTLSYPANKSVNILPYWTTTGTISTIEMAQTTGTDKGAQVLFANNGNINVQQIGTSGQNGHKVNIYGTLYGNADTASSASSATVASSLSTSSAGSSTRPVYFSGGVPVQTSTTLEVNITGKASTAGNADSANYATSASTADSANYATSAGKLSTTGAGSSTVPVYFNSSGVPVAVTSISLNVTGDLTGNADTASVAAALASKSVGSASLPVYINSDGVPVATSTTLDISITGNSNYANSAGSAGIASNIAGGSKNYVLYQSAKDATSALAPTANAVIGWDNSSSITKYSVTSGNTGDTIVVRDSKGGFSAGAITANSISNLGIGSGIYWNPYVESSSDGTDAASITVIKDGNGTGGTVLQIQQANDATDIINLKAGDVRANGSTIITSNTIGNQSVSYANTAGSATVAASLTSTSVGSASLPVYFNSNGVPVATSTTLDISITGNASTASSATSATKAAKLETNGWTVSQDGSGNLVFATK